MDSNKSVYQLNNGMWGFRFCTRVNGKNVYRRMSTDKDGKPFKTQKAAMKARAAAIAEVQNEKVMPQTPPPVQLARKTVEEVFIEFSQKGRCDRAYQTIQKQNSLWKNHLKAAFGARWIDEISTQEVNDYLLMLYYEKDFSYQYVESFLKMFYLIFGQANGRGYLSGELYSKLCQNKLTKIHMPKMKFDEDTEIHIFEKEQLQQLDEYFTGTNLELAYLLGRYCGLRINECFGLTWDCVDFDQGTIDIRVQMQYQEGIIKLVQPKTKNALRKIYLNERLLNFLRERKRQMDEGADTLKWQRLRKQRVIQDSNGQPLSSLELVNSLPDGTMQTNNSMKYHSRNIAEKYGFTFKYHFLRHTYGTQLAMMNTPLHVLCKQMGHGSTKVTEKYYIAVSKLGVDTLKKNLEQL